MNLLASFVQLNILFVIKIMSQHPFFFCSIPLIYLTFKVLLSFLQVDIYLIKKIKGTMHWCKLNCKAGNRETKKTIILFKFIAINISKLVSCLESIFLFSTLPSKPLSKIC